MKTKTRKIMLVVTSMALITVMAVAGTFAYLQDTSEDVVNTFSPNHVKVELTETDKDGDEKPQGRDDYNIIPGTEETKDPKVTVDNTVDCYVFVKVTETSDGIITYEIADGWTELDEDKYPGVYYRQVAKDAKETEFYVLKDNKVSYSASLTNEDMLDGKGNTKEIKLTFTAYAIQKEGFEDAVAAYQLRSAVYTDDAVDAKKALNDGNSLVLNDDINFNDYEEESASSSLYVNSKKEVTIELNGKTITGRSNSKYFNTIKATGNGTVITINGDGTVIGGSAANSSSSNNALEVTNKGKIIVNGGTYTVGPDKNGNGNSVVFSNGGDIIINDGFFYTDTTYNGIYWVLNKQDNSKGSIICYGGTFVNCDPSATGTEPAGQSDNFVAEGYHVVSEEQENGDIWYTVVPDSADSGDSTDSIDSADSTP